MPENDNNEQVEETKDATDVLEPRSATRFQALGLNDQGAPVFLFEQKPLSFMGKMDFFSVMGRALDKAMSGEDGLSIADLFAVPEPGPDGLTLEDFKGEDVFVRGIAKIISYAPDVMSDLFCVAWAVPRGQREMVKEYMRLPEDEGGLSDQDGADTMTYFVDQNWEVIRDFFGGQMKGVLDKIGEKIEASRPSPSSKRSKGTPQTTRRRSKS